MKKLFRCILMSITVVVLSGCGGPSDSTVKDLVKKDLTGSVPAPIIGANNPLLKGYEAHISDIEVLSKTHKKGEAAAVFKVFGEEDQPYYKVIVKVKGDAMVDARVAGMKLDKNFIAKKTNFASKATYHFFEDDDGSWIARFDH